MGTGMGTGCALDVHWMCTGCALDVHWMCTGCAALDVHWMCSCCALHARCMQHSTHYVITTPTPTRVTLHASIRRRGVTSPGPRPRLSMARFTLAILTRAALSIAALAMAGSDALSASLGPMRSRTSRCGKTCPFWSGCVAPPRAVPAPPSPCAYRMCIWTVRCVGTTICYCYYAIWPCLLWQDGVVFSVDTIKSKARPTYQNVL